jgi:pectinesterase
LGSIRRYFENHDASAAYAPSRRSVLAGAMGTIAFTGVAGTGIAGAKSSARDAIVVDPDPRNAGLRTVGEALAKAAAINAARPQRVRILLAPGVYREKLTVTQPGVTIEGRGSGAILVFDAAAGKTSPDGSKWGTGRSATLTLAAPGTTLRNLTIRNDFDFVANQAPPAGNGAQAVALSVARGADDTVIENCSLEGYQDTLYLSSRTQMRHCRISGCVDFIFGGAFALIDRCTIVSRFVPGALAGFVAAPSTPAVDPYGLIFRDCRLTREAGVPDGTIFLGRPWRAGGNMSLLGMAAYLDCWMDAHIARAGWTSMGFRDPDGVQRQLMPLEARLFESNSRGPGSADDPLRRHLSAEQHAALRANGIRGRVSKT